MREPIDNMEKKQQQIQLSF